MNSRLWLHTQFILHLMLPKLMNSSLLCSWLILGCLLKLKRLNWLQPNQWPRLFEATLWQRFHKWSKNRTGSLLGKQFECLLYYLWKLFNFYRPEWVWQLSSHHWLYLIRNRVRRGFERGESFLHLCQMPWDLVDYQWQHNYRVEKWPELSMQIMRVLWTIKLRSQCWQDCRLLWFCIRIECMNRLLNSILFRRRHHRSQRFEWGYHRWPERSD